MRYILLFFLLFALPCYATDTVVADRDGVTTPVVIKSAAFKDYSSFAAKKHSATHATGQPDAITPAAIGALKAFYADAAPYNAVGNGTADDYPAIQAAINAAAVAGGGDVVLSPLKTYRITQPLTIGNGTSSTWSTYNGVRLICQSIGGLTYSNPNTQATIKSEVAGPAIIVQGPISGWGIENIRITFNTTDPAASGVYVVSGQGGVVKHLYVRLPIGYGVKTTSMAGLNQNTMHNRWENVKIDHGGTATYQNAVGVWLTGVDSNSNTCFDTWDNLNISPGSMNGPIGVKLAWSDNNSFRNLQVSGNTARDYGIVFDYNEVSGWGPLSNFFYGLEVSANTLANVGNPIKPASFNNKIYGYSVINRPPYDGSLTVAPAGTDIIYSGYTLPTASASTLGGIKIGSRLTITDGVLSADVQGNNGASSFDQLSGGTNTTAAMVVGTGGSVNYTGGGTINASTLAGKSIGTAANNIMTFDVLARANFNNTIASGNYGVALNPTTTDFQAVVISPTVNTTSSSTRTLVNSVPLVVPTVAGSTVNSYKVDGRVRDSSGISVAVTTLNALDVTGGTDGAYADTITSLNLINVENPAKNGSSSSATIANVHGLRVRDLTTAGTNIAVRSDVTSGTNKWFLYGSGNAASALSGSLKLGATTSPAEVLDVAGNIKATGSLTVGSIPSPGAIGGTTPAAITGTTVTGTTFIAGYTALTDASATISTDTTRLTITSTTARTLTLPATLPAGTSTANITIVSSGAIPNITIAAASGGTVTAGDAGWPTYALNKRQRLTCVSENAAATTTAAWDCYQAGGAF